MDDIRDIPPEPAGETAGQRFKRRLRTVRAPDPERVRQWKEENREAIEAFRKWDETYVSPLDKYRTF